MRVLNGSAPVTGGAKSKAKAKGEGAAAGTGGTETVIATWSAGREPLVARTEQLLEELKASGTPHFSMLAVANRQLKSMISGQVGSWAEGTPPRFRLTTSIQTSSTTTQT